MHFLHGFLGSPLRAVAIRVGLQVCLKDRFQDQLGRGLHHPVPDRRDSQGPLPAVRLRDHYPSHWLRLIGSFFQLLPQLRQPAFPPLGLDPPETLAIHSRRSAVGFRQLVGVGEDVLPVNLVVEQVEAVVRFRLRLAIQLSL